MEPLDSIANSLQEIASASTSSISTAALVVSCISLIITFFGVLIALYQLSGINNQLQLAVKVYQEDHERSQKQLALDTISAFTKGMKPEFRGLNMMLDSLDKRATEFLSQGKEFHAPKEQYQRITNIIDEVDSHKTAGVIDEGNSVTVSEECSIILRAVVNDFMNTLELAVAPAYTGICDAEIIKEQLKPYFIRTKSDGKSELIMREIRSCYRREHLPNTFDLADEFATELLGKAKIPRQLGKHDV